MSNRFPKNGPNKLFRLLYDETIAQARRRTPAVSGVLSQMKPEGSALDQLMQYKSTLKSLEQAAIDLPADSHNIKSNILRFPCLNSLLTSEDFYNIYPLEAERTYELPKELKLGPPFKVVKSRNPSTLAFKDSYYLIFPTHAEAAAYWLETQNKSLNGWPLLLKFVGLNKFNIGSIFLPYFSQVPANEYPSGKLEEISKLADLDYDSNYAQISNYLNVHIRRTSVLVKNIPFYISKHALPRLLWNYDFPNYLDPVHCFIPVIQNPQAQVSLNIIRFANNENARRFVRSFHGKRWQDIGDFNKQKSKKLYEPLLCELIE